MEDDLISPHTAGEYYSSHGILVRGWIIGYAYLTSPMTPDAYVIDFSPRSDNGTYHQGWDCRIVTIEISRVRCLPEVSIEDIRNQDR